MDYLSAPWREEYVRNVFKMNECIFCSALKKKNDKEAFILYRGVYNFIILNIYPYNPGHIMIAPFQHFNSFEKSKKISTDELTDLLKLSLGVLRKQYKPQGFNTGMNIGKSAGAGVAGHYHFHVIPRWIGDSNFMPLICETRMTIEDIHTTYNQLYPLFNKEK